MRVRLCGICGSDLHAYEGTQPFFRYPQVPGHEVVGEVMEIRPRPGGPLRLPNRPVEEGLMPGERVVLDPAMPCGACHPCTRGRYNCCEKMRVIGVHAPGALAEYVVVPLECLQRVPEEMSDELAVLVEPVSIGVQANNRGRVEAGDTVLVIGAGPIGLCVMMVAKARGARVAMADLSAARCRNALAMGAEVALDPHTEDFREKLRAFAGANGPQVVVEAVGTAKTVAQAVELVVAGGRVVVLGLVSQELRLPGDALVRKELDVVGSRLHGGTIPEAVKLMAQEAVRPGGLITHRIRLDGVIEALGLMAVAPDKIIKAVAEVG